MASGHDRRAGPPVLLNGTPVKSLGRSPLGLVPRAVYRVAPPYGITGLRVWRENLTPSLRRLLING
jgi:hypothetical protein